MKLRHLAALAALLLLAACRRGPDSPALVKVNGEAVSLAQVETERGLLGAAAPDSADVVEDLIDQALVMQEGDRLGIKLSSIDLANAQAYALAGTDLKLLEETLTARGLTLKAWQERLARAARMDEVVRQSVRRRVDVSRQEIQDHYWEHLPSYRSPQRLVLRQVYVKDRDAADKALRELQLGDGFAEVALRHGQGPEAPAGGLLGPVTLSQLPKALAKAAALLKPGRYSPVLRSPWGWHILYLEAQLPPESQSLDQAAPKAQASLSREKEQLLYQAWLAHLREKAVIERLAPVPTPPVAPPLSKQKG